MQDCTPIVVREVPDPDSSVVATREHPVVNGMRSQRPHFSGMPGKHLSHRPGGPFRDDYPPVFLAYDEP